MFVTLTALSVVAPAFSLEVKLICSIKLTTTYSSGRVESENYTDLIAIEDDGKGHVSISSQSNKVTDFIPRMKAIIVNSGSDSNKYSIDKIMELKDEKTYFASITIDRNTGILSYIERILSSFPTISKSATGSCEKVDATKRKF